MPRIQPVTAENADPKAAQLLEGVEKGLGMVPNMMATMARSPAALQGYLGLSQALGAGSLGGALREQIALAVAGANACGYCASAHTLLAGGQGVDGDEAAANLEARSDDPRTGAALSFARTVVAKRGLVSDADLEQVRAAGFDDGHVAEIIAEVALNTFTNYFNHVADPVIDFPEVQVGELATA